MEIRVDIGRISLFFLSPLESCCMQACNHLFVDAFDCVILFSAYFSIHLRVFIPNTTVFSRVPIDPWQAKSLTKNTTVDIRSTVKEFSATERPGFTSLLQPNPGVEGARGCACSG
jgi:hypothetical protein